MDRLDVRSYGPERIPPARLTSNDAPNCHTTVLFRNGSLRVDQFLIAVLVHSEHMNVVRGSPVLLMEHSLQKILINLRIYREALAYIEALLYWRTIKLDLIFQGDLMPAPAEASEY